MSYGEKTYKKDELEILPPPWDWKMDLTDEDPQEWFTETIPPEGATVGWYIAHYKGVNNKGVLVTIQRRGFWALGRGVNPSKEGLRLWRRYDPVGRLFPSSSP